MTVQAMSWVLDHSPVTGTDRLVLLAIANHAGKEKVNGFWEAYPGVALIAHECRIKRTRTIQASLTRLCEEGHLERIINGAPDERIPKDRRPNLYRILEDHGESVSDTPTGCRIATKRGDTYRPDGVTVSDTQTVSKPSLNQKKSRNKSDSASFMAEAQRLCELLADTIDSYDEKTLRPNVTQRWVDEMERMLRIDQRNPAHVERCIKWFGAGETGNARFWQAVILSPLKLRAKFDQMLLQSKAEKQQQNQQPEPSSGQHRYDREPVDCQECDGTGFLEVEPDVFVPCSHTKVDA